MQILGLIPARAGSTGVKRKNVRPLAGRPLLEYTVEAARQSRLDRVILSTDAEDFAAIGRRVGAEAPFLRPADFASTEAKAIEVVGHCLDFLAREENWEPDAVFYLQPTSPFRSEVHIDEAIAALSGATAASVVSVMPPAQHPCYIFTRDGGGRMHHLLDMAQRPERRQDLPEMFALNNAVMLSRTHFLKQQAAQRGLVVNLDDFIPYFVDHPVTVDINTEEDFQFADFLMQRKNH